MISWNQVVREYGPLVYGVALRIAGQSADAEDITQEVFLEVHRLWKAREVEHWTAALRTLASRRAIDFVRKRGNVLLMSDDSANQPANAASNPEQMAALRELEIIVRESIARLPPQQAEVFSLHYLEGLSHEEIASALKIGAAGVASALYKARTTLAEQLKPLLSKQE